METMDVTLSTSASRYNSDAMPPLLSISASVMTIVMLLGNLVVRVNVHVVWGAWRAANSGRLMHTVAHVIFFD